MAHHFNPISVSEPEDLEQIGYFGLIRAIERFAPQGYAFSSFAVPIFEVRSCIFCVTTVVY